MQLWPTFRLKPLSLHALFYEPSILQFSIIFLYLPCPLWFSLPISLFSPQLTALLISLFFSPAVLASVSFFFTLDLIFFHFPPDIFSLFVLTCCSLFHCPLLSLSEDGKSNKDCFFFPVFISADKNMVPIEHSYNIQKMWENSFFSWIYPASPSDCWGSALIRNMQQRDWCLNW